MPESLFVPAKRRKYDIHRGHHRAGVNHLAPGGSILGATETDKLPSRPGSQVRSSGPFCALCFSMDCAGEEESVLSSGRASFLSFGSHVARPFHNRIRATQVRIWAAGLSDHPNYWELSVRLSMARANAEAAYMEARRRFERESMQ